MLNIVEVLQCATGRIKVNRRRIGKKFRHACFLVVVVLTRFTPSGKMLCVSRWSSNIFGSFADADWCGANSRASANVNGAGDAEVSTAAWRQWYRALSSGPV